MIGGWRIVGCFVGVRETKEIIGRDENARDEMRKVAKRMSRRRRVETGKKEGKKSKGRRNRERGLFNFIAKKKDLLLKFSRVALDSRPISPR